MIGSAIAVWWSMRTAFPVTGAILILAAVLSALFLPRHPDVRTRIVNNPVSSPG